MDECGGTGLGTFDWSGKKRFGAGKGRRWWICPMGRCMVEVVKREGGSNL